MAAWAQQASYAACGGKRRPQTRHARCRRMGARPGWGAAGRSGEARLHSLDAVVGFPPAHHLHVVVHLAGCHVGVVGGHAAVVACRETSRET